MLLTIDNRDRVESVSDSWAEMSAESGADHLLPRATVGRPYREFIARNHVAEVYRTLLEQIRMTREVVRFPVRADSARQKRRLELELEVVGAGGVEFRLTLLEEEPRPPTDWSSPPEEDEMIRMCTFCRRAQWDLEWMPLPDAIGAGDLFGEFKHWQISHGSCPDCLQERLKELQGG